MLANFLYYLVTGAEAVLSVFGIRSFYEQPPYAVVEQLGDAIEIRSYGPRLAVETTVEGSDSHTAENEAFQLLLSYIAGANRGSARFAMDAPVEQASQPSLIAMTAPVEITGKQSNRVSMRFFLPGALAAKGAPEPLDNRVRIVEVAPSTLAVVRFSSVLNEDIGGSYVAIHPNAVPTLKNFGLIMYEPGGSEKATNAAYTASELAGTVLLIFFIPLQ